MLYAGLPRGVCFTRSLFQDPFTVLVFNALLIASNGTDSRVGPLTADWERFFEVLPRGHRAARARV
jgi:hypothetical protein